LSLIWCGAASATTYINPTGKTTLNLSEKANNRSGWGRVYEIIHFYHKWLLNPPLQKSPKIL